MCDFWPVKVSFFERDPDRAREKLRRNRHMRGFRVHNHLTTVPLFGIFMTMQVCTFLQWRGTGAAGTQRETVNNS